jgi:hypothetical protein
LARDVSFTPNSAILSAGDELRCTARGNPSPVITLNYEEFGSDEKDQIPTKHGSGWRSLVVADKWVGRQVSVICSASNEVDSVPQTASNSISFNVTEAKKDRRHVDIRSNW